MQFLRLGGVFGATFLDKRTNLSTSQISKSETLQNFKALRVWGSWLEGKPALTHAQGGQHWHFSFSLFGKTHDYTACRNARMTESSPDRQTHQEASVTGVLTHIVGVMGVAVSKLHQKRPTKRAILLGDKSLHDLFLFAGNTHNM